MLGSVIAEYGKLMMKLNGKIFFLSQVVVFLSISIFLSSCETLLLECHKARCGEFGFKEGSQEMEECANDLLKKEKQERRRQSYDVTQSRAQQHLDSAQIKWKKRELQQKSSPK
ncbi:hypothetical protein IM40_06700 [Candidatus Paracaedimonas acanthamoebae]|nr:hypothetical protein IM40_06700 [Candidatus Paracaedimonas acanthamoebae]